MRNQGLSLSSPCLFPFSAFVLSLLTYLGVADIVNVWDNVSKFIERQMALQKVSKFSRVLKVLHVQWNVSCTANFARLLKSRESFITATVNLFKSNNYQRSGKVYMIPVTLFKVKKFRIVIVYNQSRLPKSKHLLSVLTLSFRGYVFQDSVPLRTRRKNWTLEIINTFRSKGRFLCCRRSLR